MRTFQKERLAFLSARALDCICIRTQFIPCFLGEATLGRGVNCVSFVKYTYRVHVAHTRLHLHLYFASEWYVEWTSAVKLKRNHREFLRGEKGGWLSREDPFSSPRQRGTAVIGGTFLSKCSFLSRHSREHEGASSRALKRIPGVTCYREKTFIRQLYVITRYRNP